MLCSLRDVKDDAINYSEVTWEAETIEDSVEWTQLWGDIGCVTLPSKDQKGARMAQEWPEHIEINEPSGLKQNSRSQYSIK